MLFRLLVIGIMLLVAIPERWVAPTAVAEIDDRGFCERNQKLCGAPREVVRELSRKTRLIIARMRQVDNAASPNTPAPDASSAPVARLSASQSAADTTTPAAGQTLTEQDRAAPWRAPRPDKGQ